MRRALAILLAFGRTTGHEHPHLRVVMGNYADLLGEMGRSPEQIEAEMQSL